MKPETVRGSHPGVGRGRITRDREARIIRTSNSREHDFQKVITEIHRIRWKVESIQRHAFVFKKFAELIFERDSGNRARKSFAKTDDREVTCVRLGNLPRLSREDHQFLRITKSMEPLFAALVLQNPDVLHSYITSPRGIMRGYPWNDFSVLPPDFDATKHPFFYVADRSHDPEGLPTWTEPYLCPVTRTWMATCSAPVYKESELSSVLGIDVNLLRIINPLDDILQANPSGYTFVVSPSGNLVISSDRGMESLWEEDVLRWQSRTKSGVNGNNLTAGDVAIEKVTLSSGKAYVARGYIRCNKWTIFCVLPLSKRAKPLTINITAEPLSLTQHIDTERPYLPMMSFISSFSESLKQIEKLIEGTKIIGRGALDHRIAVERKDEIGLLAVSINEMAAELQKRKEELDSAYRRINQMDRLSALGQLTAGIAHEINNPLSIISNYVQILLRNQNLSHDVRSDIVAVYEEIHRTSGIIKKLLSLSGKTVAGKEVVQVNDVLDNTLRFLRFQLRDQGITLVERYGKLPLTIGSPTELQQAFMNILLNAAQAMTKGGRLEVSTAEKQKRSRRGKNQTIDVVVSDTGKGIEGEFLDKIFDPFFSLKATGQGSGLGLSISYGIIKEHGGRIEVSSRPGKGTKVRITIPVVEDSSRRGDA